MIEERAPGFVVLCVKPSGVKVEFKRYADRQQAEVDAAGLRRVGCPAEVVEIVAETVRTDATVKAQ